MNEKLSKALGFVDPKYIAAAAGRKKRPGVWLGIVAAILALVFLLNTPSIPLAVTAKAVSLASDSRKTERPDYGSEQWDAWWEETKKREADMSAALPGLAEFSKICSSHVLSGDHNALWSPTNAYIGLAMTAELVEGDTKEELMTVLDAASNEELRSGISAIWESIYRDNGKEVSVLANSLWLDNGMTYNQEVMDLLSHHYYASVYQGDLGSERTNRAIATWLSNQTGGFLKDRTEKVQLTKNSLLALVSTVYFQAQWSSEFDRSMNRPGTFHSPGGDRTVTYMKANRRQMNYYWGEDYGAVALGLKNGSTMWLILPDEGKTVADVLQRGEYMNHFIGAGEEHSKYLKVNLTLPRFDISSRADLKPALQAMGLQRIFSLDCPDFAHSIYADTTVYLESIRQDSRVAIDEEGVIAASYIILNFGAGAAAPPEEEIDFTLDRPFLFVITHSGAPLFMGVVNEP